MKTCHKCGTEWIGHTQPGVHETCVGCGEALHCCLNCALHEPSMPNECRSTTTDPIQYRDRANFCDEFQFAEGAAKKDDASKKDAMDAWKKLFGDD